MSTQFGVAAVSAAPVDPLVALLVGAFGAALLTVLGGLIGAWIQAVRDHRKWLRERRFEAYREFIVTMSHLVSLITAEITPATREVIKSRLEAMRDQAIRSNEEVSMLGPRSVNAAGQDWMGAMNDAITDPSESNQSAMSRGRWQFLIAAGKVLKVKNVGANPPVAKRL